MGDRFAEIVVPFAIRRLKECSLVVNSHSQRLSSHPQAHRHHLPPALDSKMIRSKNRLRSSFDSIIAPSLRAYGFQIIRNIHLLVAEVRRTDPPAICSILSTSRETTRSPASRLRRCLASASDSRALFLTPFPSFVSRRCQFSNVA